MTDTKILDDFIADYCNRVDTTLDILKSRTRKRDVVEKRMVIAYVLRDMVGLTLARAGKCINKDHATIIHYTKTIKRFLSVYPHIKRLYGEAIKSYDEFKVLLHVSYNTPIIRNEREAKLVDILLENQEKLKLKIHKLEKEIYGKEN